MTVIFVLVLVFLYPDVYSLALSKSDMPTTYVN